MLQLRLLYSFLLLSSLCILVFAFTFRFCLRHVTFFWHLHFHFHLRLYLATSCICVCCMDSASLVREHSGAAQPADLFIALLRMTFIQRNRRASYKSLANRWAHLFIVPVTHYASTQRCCTACCAKSLHSGLFSASIRIDAYCILAELHSLRRI